MSAKITVTTEVELSITVAAQWFSNLDDEAQADFFIKVAELSKPWGALWTQQYYLVGRHLATCQCSTDEARQLVESISEGLRQ